MHLVLRLSGFAAIGGGALRIANVFTGTLPPPALAAMYFATDILLLAGIAGVWWERRATLRLMGTIGIAVFVAGIATVRASAFGVGSYVTGAVIALVGLAVYGLEALYTRAAAPWAPAAWVVSFAVLLIGVQLRSTPLFDVSALLFGAGFVAAGAEALRR